MREAFVDIYPRIYKPFFTHARGETRRVVS